MTLVTRIRMIRNMVNKIIILRNYRRGFRSLRG